MNRLHIAAVSGVFGAASAVGLQQEHMAVVTTPTTTEHIHDGAEAEIASTPHIVEFTLNRAMRREIGGKALTGTLSAPEGIASREVEDFINDTYDFVRHRANSTQRSQF